MSETRKLYLVSFMSLAIGLCLMHAVRYYSSSKTFGLITRLSYQENLRIYSGLLANHYDQNYVATEDFRVIALKALCESYEQRSK